MSNEAYAKRAKELGHGIISSCEHGWQGRYIECFELAQQYGLKFVEAAEAYWVKDRTLPDRTNCHIVLAAKNEKGRRALNKALSEANISGFYGQARLDIPLLLSLPPQDIIVQTACVAYWKYDDVDDITLRLHDHFKENFYLEVQPHVQDIQRKVNSHVLELHSKYKIPLILGVDSHYIYPNEALERSDYIASKGMNYADESGFILDYPDGDEVYRRFSEQCVLGHAEIMEAMNNTNVYLSVEEYDCPCFNHEIKMPSLYPDKTQEERDAIYDNLIWSAWEKEKKNIPPEKHELYEREIKSEMDIVHVTKHADYFILDHEVVKEGIKQGGVITSTGRGSGPSFYTNKLLGLTEIDRIAAPVKMYPERFMSPTRILSSRSLADVDLNVADRAPFLKAQKTIFGEDQSWPMIAYGTLKTKAAWKMYAKSQNIDFELANQVSEQIDRYEMAQKHNDDDQELDPFDYIDKEYQQEFARCGTYLGITSHVTPHPCATLVYNGNISEEIGLINVKGEICTVMDGKWAEEYKFLKNDWLKVSVVDLIDRVFKRIGKDRIPVTELLKICDEKSPVWDIYKKGCTLGINQVEQPGTSQRVGKYAPQSDSELCAFVAAIRPGFASMYKTFESRTPFSYGIPTLDAILQTPQMPNSFILYQELAMAVINYAGIPMSECYEIIKNIAKKRVEKVLAYKEKFLDGFTKSLIANGESGSSAGGVAQEVWRILEDSSRYSFNCSHSYSVAIDSMYGAYLKTFYPVEFYETFLRLLDKTGDKDRMKKVQEEAEDYFGIRFPAPRFGQDNRDITGDAEEKIITSSISSIKGYGKDIGDILYECTQQEHISFMSVLLWLDARSIKAAKVKPLILIDYFRQFGNCAELLAILNMFDFLKQGKAKTVKAVQVDGSPMYDTISPYMSNEGKDGKKLLSYKIMDMPGLLDACEQYLRNQQIQEIDMRVKMQNQLEILGYIDLTTNDPDDRRKVIVTDVSPIVDKTTGKPWVYRVNAKSIGTGKTARLSVKPHLYEASPFAKGDIIYAASCSKTQKGYWYLQKYNRIT